MRGTGHILRCANPRTTGRMTVKHLLLAVVVSATLAIAAFAAQTQNPPAQQPPPTADPYANNATPGTAAFPLAAPAGKDSGARMLAPPGAANQGPFDPATWKYGGAFDPPQGAK